MAEINKNFESNTNDPYQALKTKYRDNPQVVELFNKYSTNYQEHRQN